MSTGEYSASLDGVTLDGDSSRDQVPGGLGTQRFSGKRKRQPDSGARPMASRASVMVSGAKLAHVYVYDGTTGILIEQHAEPDAGTRFGGAGMRSLSACAATLRRH